MNKKAIFKTQMRHFCETYGEKNSKNNIVDVY